MSDGGERLATAEGNEAPAARSYRIARAAGEPELAGDWDGPVWGGAAVAAIDHFYARSSDHRPRARAKVLYDAWGLHVLFDVEDRFIRSVRTEYQQQVCRDSCVEFFIEPAGGRGYFNFEINAGGTLLVYHVTDASGPKRAYTVLPRALLERVRIYHSLPAWIEPEIVDWTNWRVEAAIPWGFFESQLGSLTVEPGTRWRGNFYKCADESTHPHWASWAVVEGELNFHKPACFAPLCFAG